MKARARYHGTCAECRDEIVPGALIKRNLRNHWVHAPRCDQRSYLRLVANGEPLELPPEPTLKLPAPLPPSRRTYDAPWVRTRAATKSPAARTYRAQANRDIVLHETSRRAMQADLAEQQHRTSTR